MGLFLRTLAVGVLFALVLIPVQSWAADAKDVTLYKNPACGCCDGYAEYLRENGFKVNVVEVDDLDRVNEEYGVPPHLSGCHAALVGGYVVEGHVSVALVKRLLAEKPKIAGISLPGMSPGTPGMGGHESGTLAVYEIAPGASVFGTQ